MDNINLNDILGDLMEGREEEANAKIHKWFIGIGRGLVNEAEAALSETNMVEEEVAVAEEVSEEIVEATEEAVEEVSEETVEEAAPAKQKIEIIQNKDGSVHVVNHEAKMEIFFQPGDDANSFLEDYIGAEEAEMPNAAEYVWDMYSTVSTPIEEDVVVEDDSTDVAVEVEEDAVEIETVADENKAEKVLADAESLKGGDATLDLLSGYLAYILGKTDSLPTDTSVEKLNSELDAEVLRLGGDLEDYSILNDSGRGEAVKLYNEIANLKPAEIVGNVDLIDLAVSGLEKQIKINKENGPIADFIDAVSNLEVAESLNESVLANAFKVEFPTAKPVKIKAETNDSFELEDAPKFEKSNATDNINKNADDDLKVIKK